jgi:NitT/TauT family transport system substrate-binding protein
MSEKPVIRVGHLRITDHLILGITKERIDKGEETFNNLTLQTVPVIGWNQVGKALTDGSVDAAFILAPYAMELFHSGMKMKLVLLGHKTGSIIIKNKRANIEKIEDFKGKTVLIPYHLSVHNMIFDKLLREKGLSIGVGKDVVFEVEAPQQIPEVVKWDEKGTIGGFIVAEPIGSQVVKEGYGEEFALSKDIWPNHPCCIFVVKDEILAKYPEAVQELTNSLVKSGNFISEKPLEAAKMSTDFLQQPLDIIEKVLTQPKDRVITNELLPVVNELDMMQTYLTQTIKAMSGKIDLEKFVDLQFAKAAGAK